MCVMSIVHVLVLKGFWSADFGTDEQQARWRDFNENKLRAKEELRRIPPADAPAGIRPTTTES